LDAKKVFYKELKVASKFQVLSEIVF